MASIAGVSVQIVAEVVEHFRQSGCNFLVATPSEPLTGETTLDISHESLLRQWQRLAGGSRPKQTPRRSCNGWLAMRIIGTPEGGVYCVSRNSACLSGGGSRCPHRRGPTLRPGGRILEGRQYSAASRDDERRVQREQEAARERELS